MVEVLRLAMILLILLESLLIIFVHRVARGEAGNVRDYLYSCSNSRLGKLIPKGRISIIKMISQSNTYVVFPIPAIFQSIFMSSTMVLLHITLNS